MHRLLYLHNVHECVLFLHFTVMKKASDDVVSNLNAYEDLRARSRYLRRWKSLHATLLCGKQSDQWLRRCSIFQHFYSLYFKVGNPIAINEICKELGRLSLSDLHQLPSLYVGRSLCADPNETPFSLVSPLCSRWAFQHKDTVLPA